MMPVVLGGDVRLIDCSEEDHAAAILDILNDAILHSTALYDYGKRPLSTVLRYS